MVEETGPKTKLKLRLGKRAYWIGGIGITLGIVIIVAVILHWDEIRGLGNYGYLGAFLISVFGGATIIAPIPMTPVVFTLGAVTKPAFAPNLGPVFIGAAAGIGEAIGGLTIYMTGYGGGAAVLAKRHAKLERMYERIMGWMERRGALMLFVMSAVINPFFYPVALTAGALRFGVRRFFLITWAGKTIKGMSVAAAGYWGLGSLLRALGIPI
jgi:membrane protein DedA with SNARE-associated domain